MPSRIVDHLQWWEDGTIRSGNDIVIMGVEWDEFDTPTFMFMHEGYRTMQPLRQEEVLLSEHTLIHHRLEDEELAGLLALEKQPWQASGARKQDRPKALVKLVALGLVEEEDAYKGWDEEGMMLQNITMTLTPQARGFLDYLHKHGFAD